MVDKSHMEPAHPMVVTLHDTLVSIYKVIREKYQSKIDAAFDEVSRQIGFVVTTTVPVEVEVADNGKIKSANVAGPSLKGTLFEKIASTIGTDALGGSPSPGKYSLYLIWYPALKLRLRTDFVEPAHLAGGGLFGSVRPELAAARFVPGVREPAHWFDAGVAIAGEEAILISAIDEVYPELRLAERISTARLAGRRPIRPEIPEPAHFLAPGVREPAHFGPGVREPAHLPGVQEPAHFTPGIREPAHFQQLDKVREFAQELAALIKRFGM